MPPVRPAAAQRAAGANPVPRMRLGLAMTLDEFLARVRVAYRRRDGQWVAHCPAHDDRHPSLIVAAGDRAPLLVRCFAGCTFEQIMNAVHAKQEKESQGKEKTAGRRTEPAPDPDGLTPVEREIVERERRARAKLAPFQGWYDAQDEARGWEQAAAVIRAQASALGDTPAAWDLLVAAAACQDEARRWDEAGAEGRPSF